MSATAAGALAIHNRIDYRSRRCTVPFFWPGDTTMQYYPAKYLAPNAITCASLTLGLVSMFHSMAGNHESAAWFIVICVLLDKLDGTVARALNASSNFGIQLDSFSDFVTFGIAPGFLLHGLLSDPAIGGALYTGHPQWIWGMRVSVVVYVLASCLRLAKFNVLTDKIGSKFFLGIPTTLSGGLIASYIATAMKHEMPPEVYQILPGAYVILALLMVSNFRMPKFTLPQNPVLRTFAGLNVLLAYIFGFMWVFPEYLLLNAASVAVFGLIYGAIRLRHVPLGDESNQLKATSL
ncbi:MAG: phosphatidylcholine/phosphatidylserine synthase [Myxococcales bacterium]|nr:phosphatidylcholine/phosphatidylserine synthase [Myxococcales bacterium]